MKSSVERFLKFPYKPGVHFAAKSYRLPVTGLLKYSKNGNTLANSKDFCKLFREIDSTLKQNFQMQRPGLVSVNRERKPKMVPHKGVPNNVDAIFGNKRAPPHL